MTRWAQVAGDSSGEDYRRRLEALEATGRPMHGEADFVSWAATAGARVLDAGCGTGRVGVELHRRGFVVVGVDCDESMLEIAHSSAPDVTWLRRDLAELEPEDPDLGGAFDVVLLAGNVIPLLADGTEKSVLTRLSATLAHDGRVVTGFGLDVAHLPLDDVPVSLAAYDRWCSELGLTLCERFLTWDRDPFAVGHGYAVSVHRWPTLR